MSIRSKLTIIFLAIALIPLLFVSALTFNNYKDSLKANRLLRLQDLAAFRADKIETHFTGLKTCIEILQNVYVIKKNLPVLARLADNPADSEFLEAKKTLDKVLQKTSSVLGVSDIMLADSESKIVYESNPGHGPKGFSSYVSEAGQKAFKEGKDKTYFSDFFLSDGHDNVPVVLVSAPVFDIDGVFTGIVAFEADMSPVYHFIQDAAGMGNTGEVLIGRKTGGQVVFLNPLRFDPEAPLNRKVSLGESIAEPLQKAAQGINGAGELIDYRGKKVIAAWRYIPSLNLGMVAKIDAEEAFSDVTKLKNWVLIILGIIFVLCGVMIFSIARSITRPIRNLSKGVDIVGGGNLDYKLAIDSRDEIGKFSRAFDKMTRDLKNLGIAKDAERKRLYEVLETLPVYVVLLSEDYHVPFANRFFRERFGESRGKRCFEYLFKRTEPCENCETYKVMKTNAPHHWEWTGPDKRDYDIYDFPFIDTDGSRMILETGIDITERKRAEEELNLHRDHLEALVEERTYEVRSKNEELLRSNENLEQFAYVASHDLQEPLRVMASYSQLLEKRYKDKFDADADDFIGFIVDAATRMQKLITDLLAYSRAGRDNAEMARIDCNEVLGKVVAAMSTTIESNGAGITYDNLPVVAGTEISFIQLFQNLVGNALKFRSSMPPVIHIGVGQNNNHWIFCVRDNGIGIEPQYKDRIFQIFQRLHSKHEYPGTGIGLSICKKIVENYGGKIWVESEAGKGSAFYFTLPRERRKSG